jgi:Tfp pilus assembly protein PilX
MRKNSHIALRLKNSEKGFALVAAIMACLLLLALGMLVISLSTQDIRVSVRIVGEKRALAAAEEGIHSLCQAFDPPIHRTAPAVTTTRTDGVSNYTIHYPATYPKTGNPYKRLAGFGIGSGTIWAEAIYIVSVTGRSMEYTTQVTIGAGLGHGPVDITTLYQ